MIAFFDTSAVVKLLIDEDGSAAAAEAWANAERLVASMLLYPEARAAIARAFRGRRLTDDEADVAKRLLRYLVDEAHLIEPTRELLWDAAHLADTRFLRGYDAVHLASALDATADVVVTGDRELAAAALAVGLRVVLTGEAA